MSKRRAAALPIAYVILRLLILLNWLYGAAIFGLLGFTFVNEPWFMKAINVPVGTDAQSIMTGLRAIAALGLLCVPLNHMILARLLRIVETVGRGDPFVAANAYRLQGISAPSRCRPLSQRLARRGPHLCPCPGLRRRHVDA
jgi:hypothetical protein